MDELAGRCAYNPRVQRLYGKYNRLHTRVRRAYARGLLSDYYYRQMMTIISGFNMYVENYLRVREAEFERLLVFGDGIFTMRVSDYTRSRGRVRRTFRNRRSPGGH